MNSSQLSTSQFSSIKVEVDDEFVTWEKQSEIYTIKEFIEQAFKESITGKYNWALPQCNLYLKITFMCFIQKR